MSFLRFPGDRRNRIIALPAFVGGERPAVGVKWISSFPSNVGAGMPRASAAIVVNSLETGRPEALVEGSLISAKRTAAFPTVRDVVLYDADPRRAESFVTACRTIVAGEISTAPRPVEAVRAHDLVSIATTATEPHLDLAGCRPGTTVLHISLRDVHPEAVLGSRNVVDDADHVCRDRTRLANAAGSVTITG